MTLGNIFFFSRICNPLNCAQHPAQLSVVIIILKDFSSELLFCIPVFFSLLKYMSDISMLQALYYFTNLPLFVLPYPTLLTDIFYFLLHVLILFCFRFVEIRNYKIDLVSLLSVDLITGSTVIPVIPHRQGRDSPRAQRVLSFPVLINLLLCPKPGFLCFKIVKTRPIYYFLRRHSKVLRHILCFNLFLFPFCLFLVPSQGLLYVN